MSHKIAHVSGDGEFQNEIIVGVVHKRPPAETDGVLQTACGQEIQNLLNSTRMQPEMLRLAAGDSLVFQK
jgi:hypothetical protein